MPAVVIWVVAAPFELRGLKKEPIEVSLASRVLVVIVCDGLIEAVGILFLESVMLEGAEEPLEDWSILVLVFGVPLAFESDEAPEEVADRVSDALLVVPTIEPSLHWLSARRSVSYRYEVQSGGDGTLVNHQSYWRTSIRTWSGSQDSIHNVVVHLTESSPSIHEPIVVPLERIVNDREDCGYGPVHPICEVDIVDPVIYRNRPYSAPLELSIALTKTGCVGTAVRVGIPTVSHKARVRVSFPRGPRPRAQPTLLSQTERRQR